MRERISVLYNVCETQHLPGDSRLWPETPGVRALAPRKVTTVTDRPPYTLTAAWHCGESCRVQSLLAPAPQGAPDASLRFQFGGETRESGTPSQFGF